MQKRNLRELYSAECLDRRIRELGAEITAAYPDKTQELLCVCVLRGAVVFFSELVKRIDHDSLMFGFMTLSSYGSGRDPGGLKLVHELNERAEGRHVLIVEDIVDTGRTVKFLRGYFEGAGALSVRVAALLDKPARRAVDARADYTAFTLSGDPFVVGYGLDDAQYFRQLDGIYEVLS